MNYRHAFHAGNFADVLKHSVLTRVLVHLRRKPAPFRVIDTHAGEGLYDLGGPEAMRSLEWREGIGRLFDARLNAEAEALFAPYLDAVRAFNPDGVLRRYPGSPALVQAMLRAPDRLLACELQPQAAAVLAERFARDPRIKAVAIDGWTALKAYVPPPERRGLVLVDPPFEEASDFARLADGLQTAIRRWAGGTYLLWYPIKDRSGPDRLARRLRSSGIPKLLRIEFGISTPAPDRLQSCGLIIANPPWTLDDELKAMVLPALQMILGPSGHHRLEWLAGEAKQAARPAPQMKG